MIDVEVTYEGAKKIIRLKPISYADYTEIMQKVVDTKVLNAQTVGNANIMLMRRLVLERSLTEKIDFNKLTVNDGLKIEEAAWNESGLGEESVDAFPEK